MAAECECDCHDNRELTPILDALNASVKVAKHLNDLDEPTVEAARALARKIDMADLYFEKLVEAASETDSRPPSPDNVSLPTYLRYCDALGLTPISRLKFAEGKAKGGAGGKLSSLRDHAQSKAG